MQAIFNWLYQSGFSFESGILLQLETLSIVEMLSEISLENSTKQLIFFKLVVTGYAIAAALHFSYWQANKKFTPVFIKMNRINDQVCSQLLLR